jgi:NTE family protein
MPGIMFWKGKIIGLALGGGGARGLAHIGVLRVLDEGSIPIDLIVGTSAGALVGGAYASGINPGELEKKADEYLNSPEFQSSAIRAFEKAQASAEMGLKRKIQNYLKNRYLVVQAMFKPGILSNEEFQETINYFIPDIQIEDMPICFRAVATDLLSGEQIIPSSAARDEGADVVIAVAVDRGLSPQEDLRTVVDIYHRASEIMGEKLKKYELAEADVVILPEVGELHWSNFSQAMNLIEEGEKATQRKMEDIRHCVPGMKRWLPFRKRKKRIKRESTDRVPQAKTGHQSEISRRRI